MLIVKPQKIILVKVDFVQEYSYFIHLFQAFVTSSLSEEEPKLRWKCRASASADYNAEAQHVHQAMHQA